MKVIEREGRLFLQLLDGEIETTREELQKQAEWAENFIRHSETWLKLYKGKEWTIGTTPKDADFHVHLTIIFEDLEKYFEEKYHAGESLWTAYKMCDAAIFEANKSLLNPYGNTDRDKAWIARWQAMKGFLDLFPKRGAFDTTPPYEAPAPPAKGTPAADVRRYFPKAAIIHGTTATDANALHQLAVWLLHWAERPSGKRYSLPGQLREQLAAHPDAGKFLKACRRLHEALTPLAATETAAKALLDREYTPHSLNNLQAVLKWWAGWIREQTEAQRNPAGAYLAALKRMPIVEEHDNGTPRYSVPIHLLDWDGFAVDIAPLRQAFDDALPDLTPGQKRALRHDLGELLRIDRQRLKSQQELFDRQEYFPANLPADYPSLRFEVAGQSGGLSHARQWVGPMFWSGLRALLQYKQMEARTAFEKLNAAIGETLPIPEPPKPSPAPDTPAEDSCYCRTHPNAETLVNLPASCRIHEVIRGALPEIERQIAARKLADTPAGFRAYCEGELARHVKNVGDMAKNLAHPTLYSEAERPQMLELKLWNLTLCGLYKSELSIPKIIRPAPAPQRLKAPAPTVTALSEADRILGASFTLEDADQLARAVGIIDEAGIYVLGPRKLGAVVGFCLALQQAKKLVGAIPSLTAVLAPRWSTQVITRKTGTGVAEKYFKLTNKALARPKETD